MSPIPSILSHIARIKRWARQVSGRPLHDWQRLDRNRRDWNESRIRALCDNAYLGNNSSLCRVLGRYKMFVDTGDVGISSHLLLDGYWEMWLTEVFVQLVRPGMTVVDVGANLGYYTVLAAELVGAGGRVHAFEPNPPIAARLRRTITVNGFDERVSVHETPLGREEGRQVSLAVPAGEPKNAHVVLIGGEGQPVLTERRMDRVAELRRIDVIKIDAEGAELAIWDGMAGLLAERDHPLTIILEFAPIRYPDPTAFLNSILAAGFSLSEVTLECGEVIRSIEQILAGSPTTDQLLLLRRTSVA